MGPKNGYFTTVEGDRQDIMGSDEMSVLSNFAATIST
jgi:hypothetical protein